MTASQIPPIRLEDRKILVLLKRIEKKLKENETKAKAQKAC